MNPAAARHALSPRARRGTWCARVARGVLCAGWCAAGIVIAAGSAHSVDDARARDAALAAVSADTLPAFQLVESFPVETILDHPDLPQAADVWLRMIRGARARLDFAEFYASDTAGSRLGPIVEALEQAADRGVRVRFLAEKKFHATYPVTLDRLASHPGIEVRLFDVAAVMGGVLHAKYFIADAREVYVGSQNFDWRALEHILELGAYVRDPAIAGAFEEVFEYDWALAGQGAPADAAARDTRASGGYAPGQAASVLFPIGRGAMDTLRATPVFSPQGWLPPGARWDLPEIVALIDHAQATVRVQLLTYGTTSRDGRYFDALETALRRAAARGARVQMLLSAWAERRGMIEGLQSLTVLPNIEVRLVTIPRWSRGFIPYARVTHAKYLVVDGNQAWLGTSNWERDYFHDSRNAGLILEGPSVGARLDRFFEDVWESPYAVPVDPCSTYVMPRIGG